MSGWLTVENVVAVGVLFVWVVLCLAAVANPQDLVPLAQTATPPLLGVIGYIAMRKARKRDD